MLTNHCGKLLKAAVLPNVAFNRNLVKSVTVISKPPIVPMKVSYKEMMQMGAVIVALWITPMAFYTSQLSI
ncbi:unnamed protein product [Arctia plantaginis]|uniref:Uncharacterized protein n=1 Tax=Arctia plantaginis TaxID=874455 RepID=A0A8S0ZIP4_ARCPL|nr:unnamed protein product [Arctia plantaginis]